MQDASNNALCLSFDLDWAPEYMLEDFGELIESTGLPATFFCTHRSEMVDRLLRIPSCEAAVHPNLQDAQDEPAALRKLCDLFKEARGVRVHRLYYHSGLLKLFHDAGLDYLSNDLEFLRSGLEPYYDWSEMVRLPIYWEDDVHCSLMYDRFDLEPLGLERSGMKIFSFHPVHLYLNTRRMEDYLAFKGDLRDQSKMRTHRNAGAGTRTLFESLAKEARKHRTRLLGDFAGAFLLASPRTEKYGRFMELSKKS